jgi:signal peptidase I
MFGKKKSKEKTASQGLADSENKRFLKKELKKPTSWYGKIWFFIWHDNSAASWIVNILLAYLIIKFVIYPLLGLIFGTNFPIVAVVSNSMEHHMNLDDWWVKNEDYYLALNITKTNFEDYPFKNGFNRGDIMFLIGKKPGEIRIGDVIVFQSKKPYPIIHRVINKEDKAMWVFQTKGDNNKDQIREYVDPLSGKLVLLGLGQSAPDGYTPVFDETQILEKQLLGKAVLRVPWLGYVKIWFVDLMKMTGLYYMFTPGS